MPDDKCPKCGGSDCPRHKAITVEGRRPDEAEVLDCVTEQLAAMTERAEKAEAERDEGAFHLTVLRKILHYVHFVLTEPESEGDHANG